MEQTIYEVLKKLNDNSYESYVIGGYVRDKLLGKKSIDIDITTKATPKEVLELFNGQNVKSHDYGNVSFQKDGYNFDITTFRKDIKYQNHRKPEKIVYIESFKEDLARRDFTMNAICLDIDNKIIDIYDGKKDIKRKTIRAIGDADKKIEEDALRILRAVRFACKLKFRLEPSLKEAIIKHRNSLKDLSFERKREELNKILCSKNKKYGVKLLKELKLLEPLDLKNIENVLNTNDPIAIWATITDEDYAFTKNEKDLIKQIKALMNEDINDPLIEYKYGSYLLTTVSDLKKLNTKKIINKYDKLPIKDRKELKISIEEICKILNKKPDNFLKDILSDIEEKIIYGKLKNDKEIIKEYIKENY